MNEQPATSAQPPSGERSAPHTAQLLSPATQSADPHVVATVSLPPEHVAIPTGVAPPPGQPNIPGYEILRELGRGGMGVVYLARQTGLDRLVALKMIRAAGHASPVELTRFRTEAQAIARLQHPHIVAVYEIGAHDSQPFFSLEYCPGGSLAQHLAGTPLPPAQAAPLVETLARAVQAAHQVQVVHRDLKPGNVLLTADGQPKITDFGLAKTLDADSGQTHSGAILGTPSYMAPEQALGDVSRIGPACDIYALGAILYECLAGRPPFKAATVLDTLEQVRSAEPVPPSQLQSTTPRDLETICLKCLHKEPTRRYASAADLAADLRRFRAGEPIVARPVGRLGRLVKWARRRPAVAGLLAAVLLVFATGATVSTLLAVSEHAARGHAEQAADDVRREQARTQAALQELEQSHARVVATAAKGMLRPLAKKPAPVNDEEIAALWDLAGADEAVRLQFIVEAVRTPATVRQLQNRAPLALHAAVGLDHRRRAQVEHLLRQVLEADAGDAHQALAVAVAAAALDGLAPETARRVGHLLSQAVSNTTEPLAQRALA
ncbi:MAG: serine/threonine protein kinase, partial [Gemmataceae bacterium]|nr:serine/threonine protein kinase [Gemmataceae bacterium]